MYIQTIHEGKEGSVDFFFPFVQKTLRPTSLDGEGEEKRREEKFTPGEEKRDPGLSFRQNGEEDERGEEEKERGKVI